MRQCRLINSPMSLLLALLGPREMSDLSAKWAKSGHLIRLLSPIAILPPSLKIEALHLRLGIAGSGRGAGRDRRGDAREIVLGQADRQRADVLDQSRLALGPGDGDHVVALRQQPGECELPGGAFLLLGDRFELL